MDGVQPNCTVSASCEDLYDFRSEVAHGRRVSERFLRQCALTSASGEPITADYTLEQLLEEIALFMLNRTLELILSTDLYSLIPIDSAWRQRLSA